MSGREIEGFLRFFKVFIEDLWIFIGRLRFKGLFYEKIKIIRRDFVIWVDLVVVLIEFFGNFVWVYCYFYMGLGDIYVQY